MTCMWRLESGELCGRPARAVANGHPVCGVHTRSARAAGHRVEPMPGPEVGQVWIDCDPRTHNRRVKVVEVGETHATLAPIDGGRKTRVRLDRFARSNGYRRAE